MFLCKRGLIQHRQGEICVGTSTNTASAYPLMFSISPFDNENGVDIPDSFLTTIGVTKLDASYSNFIRDVYDARTPLECELAYHQISIFRVRVGEDGGPMNDCNHLINGVLAHYNDAGLDRRNMSTRRNAIVFITGRDPLVDEVGDNGTKPHVIFRTFNANTFASDLKGAILEIAEKRPPKVFTLRNKTSEGITPADWHFHGIALGMGKLDQRDGDNVCTLLRSGAQTIRNGPFKIMAGDPVGWVFPHELCCFDMNGKRKKRWTSTIPKLKRLFGEDDGERRIGMIQAEQPEVQRNGHVPAAPCPVAKVDNTGDGSKNTMQKIQVIPLRRSPGCCSMTDSVRDPLERRMGSAISNAAGHSMVDLLVGSDM